MRTLFCFLAVYCGTAFSEKLPIFDAHLHYSHDAWESVPAQ
jgi:hypothetical protein